MLDFQLSHDGLDGVHALLPGPPARRICLRPPDEQPAERAAAGRPPPRRARALAAAPLDRPQSRLEAVGRGVTDTTHPAAAHGPHRRPVRHPLVDQLARDALVQPDLAGSAALPALRAVERRLLAGARELSLRRGTRAAARWA